MSYSGRRRYKSRREKNKTVAKRAKAIVITALLALVVYLIYHRVRIYDHLATYFY